MREPIDLSAYLVSADIDRTLPAERVSSYVASLATASGSFEGELTFEGIALAEGLSANGPTATIRIKGEDFTARVTGYVQDLEGRFAVDFQIDDPEQKARLNQLLNQA